MKVNKTLIQLTVIALTFTIMALLIWGIWTGKLLNHEDTQKQIMDSMKTK